MATDRKHRRTSSPDETERSSKRHKHRHHIRHHRHRHGSKKHEEETKHENEIHAASAEEIPLSTAEEISPSAAEEIPSSVAHNYESVSNRQDDDVEEGEILEEHSLSGEIEKEEYLVKEIPSGHLNESVQSSACNSRTRGYDVSNLKFATNVGSNFKEKGSCKDAMDGLAVNFKNYDTAHDHVDHKGFHPHGSPNDDGRNQKEYDDDKLDIDRSKSIVHRYSSPESTGDKCNISRSHNKYQDEYVYWSPTRSRNHARERSLSHSVVEEDSRGRKKLTDEGANDICAEERKTKYGLDDGSRESRYRSRDIEECSASFSCRHNGMKDTHSRERKDRERSIDGDKDLLRRRNKERSMEMNMDRVHRREKERGRSKDMDVDHSHCRKRDQERSLEEGRRIDEDRGRSRERDVDMDWRRENGRGKDRDTERDRRRDTERYSRRDMERDARIDRDRRREKGRNRSWEKDRDAWRDGDRERERDERIQCREISKERERGEIHSSKNSRNSKLDEIKCLRDRKRHPEPEKAHNFSNNTLEESEDKQKREEVAQEDFDENVELKFSDQEEDDLNRIKEESRRRREAILEKYKIQGLQQPTGIQSQDLEKDEGPVDDGGASPENLDDRADDADVCIEETTFSVGKSPQNENAVPGRSSGTGGLGEGTPKSEQSDDKFCDDIFGETPTGVRKLGTKKGIRIERSGLNDNWDDAEGYYGYRFGEILDGRYEVTAAHGKGVFSTVVRARNLRPGNGEPDEVAIKIIRNNDTMYKAGMEELVILKKLVGADPNNKRHCVRFLSSFKYRNHLCLVFESLQMNLREVLKKFGRNIGLRLTAVRAYAKQLFIALKHLRNCGVLHCDIKPDNMLVNEAKNVLKLCDFGNAMFAGKNEVTPYLVSRFYRAPEIILGLQYDHPLDMWSVGCCLYELYTGKVLFPGSTNNDMLRLHMELKGTFPKKMLRKGAFAQEHFDQDLNFHATEEDPVTKKTAKRMILNIKAKDIGSIVSGSPGEEPKMLLNFKDLLDKIFILDPDKRLTVSQALNHPFITDK